MQTYWVEPKGRYCQSGFSGTDSTDRSGEEIVMGHHERPPTTITGPQSDELATAETNRLIDWTVSVFEGLFRKLCAHRQSLEAANIRRPSITGRRPSSTGLPTRSKCRRNLVVEGTPREEVVESIDLPAFKKLEAVDPDTIELPEVVVTQLRGFVSTIAQLYRPNAFHNFAHACHVTMSTKKLLQRITTLSNTLSQQEVYFHSFGLASDPLTEVAMIFSALIHDVDHPGVSNGQLVLEQDDMAVRFKDKSVAEQNSIEVAWALLMSENYSDLCDFLFSSRAESNQFRQLVVNGVMATDIFDPDLKAMRDKRWLLAFSESAQSDDPDALNRKATIVLEHLIQASDVSHTMQHWTIYQKWNTNLFNEMYGAYKEGRVKKDPCEGWYEGELWFFDNYVIPLVRKLRDCQVFGAYCQEMLDCAYENRLEWENKGRAITEEMKELFEASTGVGKPSTAHL